MDIELSFYLIQIFVFIFELGREATASELIGQYCGRQPPSEAIVSKGSFLLIVFHSDDSVEGTGFTATYQQSMANRLI